MRPLCGHKIDGLHGAQCDDGGIAAAIAGDADGVDRQKNGKGLAGLVIPAAPAQFFDEDVVSQAQGIRRRTADFAQDAYAKTGAGG